MAPPLNAKEIRDHWSSNLWASSEALKNEFVVSYCWPELVSGFGAVFALPNGATRNGAPIAVMSVPMAILHSVCHGGRGFRNGLPVFKHAFDVKFDCLSNVPLDFFKRPSGCHASWKIGDISREVLPAALDHNSVFL